MLMACPRCNAAFEDRYHCPSCGIPLVATGSSPEGNSGIYGRPRWQQTAWGRAWVGLLLAQGLYYGLWQLSTAAILALVEEPVRAIWWNTTAGGVLLYSLLAISLIIGGMMAGAGQRRSLLYGAILGFLNGLIFVVVPKDRPLSGWELYAQPLFQALLGMVGAWIGSLIWKPILPLSAAPPLSATPPPLGRLDLKSAMGSNTPMFAGPVHWVRVMFGIILAILGSFWANRLLQWILHPDTGFNLESQYHAKFVTWEISILTLLLGAGLAGAGSRSGAKQGLLVGLGVTAGLLGIYHQSGGLTLPAPSLIFELMHVRLELTPQAQTITYTAVVVVPLALIGGWFGSQLLPPLSPTRRRKSNSPAWV